MHRKEKKALVHILLGRFGYAGYLNENILFFIDWFSCILFFTAEPGGYCGKADRFLSDKYFSEVAISYYWNNMDRKRAVNITDYYYKNKNINNMQISRGRQGNYGNPGGKYGRYVLARIIYENNIEKKNELSSKYYDAYLVMDSCGKIINNYGESMKAEAYEKSSPINNGLY